MTFCSIFLLAAVCVSQQVRADGAAGAEMAARYRVFSLRHTTADRAADFLKSAGLTVSVKQLKANMISLTASRDELSKAAELIRLVDSKTEYIVETIAVNSPAGLPSMKDIAGQIPRIVLGTFSNPPMASGEKVILELHGNNVLLVAPITIAEKIEKLVAASQLPKTAADLSAVAQAKSDANLQPAEPNTPAGPVQSPVAEANQPPEKPDANKVEKLPVGRYVMPDLNSLELLDINAPARRDAKAGKPTRPSGENAPVTVDINNIGTAEANERPLSDVFNKLVTSLERPSTSKAAERKVSEVEDMNKTLPAIPKKEPPKPLKKSQPAAAGPKVPAETAAISYEPKPVADSNEFIDLELPEKVNIIQLLGLVGEYLHLDYIYDPAQIQGEVILRLSGKRQGRIRVNELYPLLETVMKYKGFVMTRRDNMVIIVPRTEAVSIDPAFIDAEKGAVKHGDLIVTRIFHLRYIDADSAKNLLTGMGLGVDINTQASRAGLLIVTEYAYRMSRVEELLKIVDVPGPAKSFRFRPLKYTIAALLKDKVKTLADQLGSVSVSIAETPARAPQPQPRIPGRPPVQLQPQPQQPTAAAPEAAAVYLDADERTNRILMIGQDLQLNIVEGLIDALDVEQQDLRSLRVYEIQYADAADIITKLEQLGIIMGGRTQTTTRTAASRRGPGPERITQPPGTPGQPSVSVGSETLEAPGEEPQIVIIETTNSLLVNATAEQHDRIATIIGYVDCEPQEASTNYMVYPLENQDPEEIAKVLNQLIEKTVENKDPSGKVVGTTVTKKTEEEITIIPDKNTFGLIVYASKRNQQWIESLIRQLDKRRPQVLIDVTLVEISKNDLFTLDLDAATKFPSLSSVGATAGNFSLPILPDSNYVLGKRIWGAGASAGTAKGFYADNAVQAVLTAMDQKGYGRILAKPKLLVNDNESGIITTKESQTVVSAQSSSVVSTGAGQTSASVVKDIYNAEIKLEIKPHISEGDLLRLEIAMTRTDIRPKADKTYSLDAGGGGKLSGPNPPDLLTSDVKTIITVPNERTIILGGLEKLNQNKGGTKVPLLGDLPLVGGLFRSTTNTDTQDRLYVFVKANILRPEKEQLESDIVRISRKNRENFEKYEKQMQEYQDWPGIKSTPMEPVKVLEED